jgi:hypothetical protein
MWPDVQFSCTDNGWTWPGVAQCLSLLAPRLAPRNPANVHPGVAKREPVSSGASTSLRHLGNQARNYPRPKAATPAAWDRAYLERGRPESAGLRHMIDD